MASQTMTVIFALFFLVSSIVCVEEAGTFRGCYLGCLEFQCLDIINLGCMQTCDDFCLKEITAAGGGANKDMFGGRPMMLGPPNGVTRQSNGAEPPMPNLAGPQEPQIPTMTNSTEPEIVNSTTNASGKSNGWPTMQDPVGKPKDLVKGRSTKSHTMDAEDQPSNSMEGSNEFGALPALLGSIEGQN